MTLSVNGISPAARVRRTGPLSCRRPLYCLDSWTSLLCSQALAVKLFWLKCVKKIQFCIELMKGEYFNSRFRSLLLFFFDTALTSTRGNSLKAGCSMKSEPFRGAFLPCRPGLSHMPGGGLLPIHDSVTCSSHLENIDLHRSSKCQQYRENRH